MNHLDAFKSVLHDINLNMLRESLLEAKTSILLVSDSFKFHKSIGETISQYTSVEDIISDIEEGVFEYLNMTEEDLQDIQEEVIGRMIED